MSDTKNQYIYNLLCGIPSLEDTIRLRLSELGGSYHPSAPLCFVIDLPLGFALQLIEEQMDTDHTYSIVTLNRCPEYCAVLTLLGASNVISGNLTKRDFLKALHTTSSQQATCNIMKSALTDAEIKCLYLISKGFSNQQIAQILLTTPQYIRNITSKILSKLQLGTRNEAALYFWDHLPTNHK